MPKTPHMCHYPPCEVATPRKLLMCRYHWRLVPRNIQQRVWSAYNKLPHAADGHCLEVSPAYIDAVNDAIHAIDLKIGHPVFAQIPFDFGTDTQL